MANSSLLTPLLSRAVGLGSVPRFNLCMMSRGLERHLIKAMSGLLLAERKMAEALRALGLGTENVALGLGHLPLGLPEYDRQRD